MVLEYRKRRTWSKYGPVYLSWCPLGRTWFSDWGGNTVMYRGRRVSLDVARIAAHRKPGRYGYLVASEKRGY